jgi:hypothetical protein
LKLGYARYALAALELVAFGIGKNERQVSLNPGLQEVH